jgi:hypothetical protein
MQKKYDFHGHMEQARKWAEILYSRVDGAAENLIVIRGTIHARLEELSRLHKLLPRKRAKALFSQKHEQFLKLVEQAIERLHPGQPKVTRPLMMVHRVEPSKN